MPWVTVNGGRYYRRSRRVGGRVVTEHVGGGPLGEMAAEGDRQTREHARLTRAAVETEWDREAAGWQAAADADRFLATLFGVLARLAGFHTHRRQWRRGRGRT